MKHLTILLVLIVFACASFAQQNVQKLPLTQAEYLKKSKHQKTWAWILTAAGTTGLLITMAADATQVVAGIGYSVVGEDPVYTSYTVPYLLSAATVAGGITLFVLAGKNKRKARAAASVFFNTQKVPVLARSTMVRNQSIPAVGLKINL